MKKNQGYTLIEMLIVIAIIAIMSGVSFVTIGIIKEAKCNAAASSLNDQMSALLVKTRAVSQAKNDKLVLQIRKNPNEIVYADRSIARAGTTLLILGTYDGTTFTAKNVDANGNDVPETIVPNFITVKYTDADGNDSTADEMYIEYNKSNGSVTRGAGKYEIVYNNATKATVFLDPSTGNHYVK